MSFDKGAWVMKTYRVLVTGSAGAIGRAVCKELKARGHFVRGLDVRETPGVDESLLGTVADYAVVAKATETMETVIHLAATVDDADFMAELLPNNVVAVFNVMDCARKAGLRRVVLASSMQTVSGLWWGRAREGILRLEEGSGCRNHYAVTKVFAETMGDMYVRQHKMSVVAVRIGWLPRNNDTVRHMASHGGGSYLSHGDAGRFFACAVEKEAVGYAVVFLVSKQKPGRGVDMEPAQRLLGFEAQDVFPEGLPFEVDLEGVVAKV